MKKTKKLSIRGTLLDKSQFASFIEKSAAEHMIKSYSSKKTFPIPNLIDDYKFILATYNLLTTHIKLGIKIHSAGEWILDNFYIIEETVKVIQKELDIKKYKSMIGLLNDRYTGFARSFVLAEEIVAFSDCKVDRELIDIAIESYQKKKVLSMDEFSNIGIFIKISLISHIRYLCEKIYSSELQKFKVENIIERVIDKKSENNLIFKNNTQKLNIKDNTFKYSFIEYMSYKLKQYGKNAISYQSILNKEVQKLGLTVSEVIEKEHFHIANTKISLGNCITSIKEIGRIDFLEIFSKMNASEDILNSDPAGIYCKLDEDTKCYFRNIIEKKAQKNKISEIYVSEKLIEIASQYAKNNGEKIDKKSHIGYYLLKEDGIKELDEALEIQAKKRLSNRQNARLYIGFTIFVPIIFCLMIIFIINQYVNSILLNIFSFFILYVPISEIVLRITNYMLTKFKSPVLIPKMNYEDKIPEERTTFVVIPTILKNKEKVYEMLKKLEVYYLANKLDNIYFALLGDCSEEEMPKRGFDNEVIETGIEVCKKLNEKYKTCGFNRFHFLYRKRLWNECEGSYIGWERKRGILATFNKYIKGKINNNFWINTLEEQKEMMPNIKYIITLDSDTNLNLESASKLIGAMSYILNEPVIENYRIVDGYGIMQPRIGMDLAYSQKSLFVELFNMKGGIDCYSNAISDFYQDFFDEGIFTGKGIYDVDVYNEILGNEFPENTILSHDLLEGNFLRCGLLTDVILIDGYPLKYLPYIERNHRWTRGDWQIIKWIRNSRLNEISKYKIYDNLRRSLLNIFVVALILLSTSCSFLVNNQNVFLILLIISLISITIPFILDIINYIIFKESNITGAFYSYKKFSGELSSLKISFLRIFLQIAFLPYETYKNLDAIIRSIYRMKNKVKLLEWVTAEETEKNTKDSLNFYYRQMIVQVIFGMIFFVLPNMVCKVLGVWWILGPLFAWYVSRVRNENIKILNKDKNYLLEIAKRTWTFFEENITEENNYLIPDNYQEDRRKRIVNRTSSTNIGLELLSIISAYDLGFINFKKTVDYLNKIIFTIVGLSKWNGHLYNWYDTKNLSPLYPRYISTVDSGNFVGYLFVLKQFLEQNKNKSDCDNLFKIVQELINNTDFSKLYSYKNKLFSIGFNLEENALTDSYYDFLASEARQASIVAIAKKDIPVKHWNNLSRTLTCLNGYKGLISWTGTAFEYLMPNINLERYKGSILDEASKFAVMSQIEYAKKIGIPWGISEAAFNLKDLNNNYQYKAFGIPWLGLKRGLEEDIVVSPYSTFLSLEDEFDLALKNLRYLEQEGLLGKYGFYESIDYTKGRCKENGKAVVKTYMAHHQGLILLSINNILKDKILRKRFNQNPEIEATNILLEERMPINLIITKEKKEKIVKNKMQVVGAYFEKNIESAKGYYNILTNGKYKILIDDFGNSSSEFSELLVNNYKKTSELHQGMDFILKNIRTKKIINTKKNSNIIFSQDKVQFIKSENNLKLNETVFIDPNKPIEIRRLKIENIGNQEEIIEIVFVFEPSLSKKMQEYAHPIFNKMFNKFYLANENIIFEKKDRELDKSMYLATTLYTENEQIVDFEFEIDKEKYFGRENYDIEKIMKSQKAFFSQITQVIEPIIAMKRTIKIKAKEKAVVTAIIAISDNQETAIENVENLKSEDELIRILNVAKVRTEEESKYLQVNSRKIELYFRFLNCILKNNVLENEKIEFANIDSLWKFGISGNNMIILVKLEKLEDIYSLEDILNAYEYYRAKKIFFDLVIINYEKNVYEKFVRDSINEIIFSKQLNYLKNIDTGIFILNNDEILKEDLQAIEYKAKIIIDCALGGIESYLNENENRIFYTEKNEKYKLIEQVLEIYPLKKPELEIDNSFGGFKNDGKEYFIYKNSENILPSSWCNVLSNNIFGTVVTDNLGGYIWSKNSRLNRLTAWNNDYVLDFPSEIYYFKDEENKAVWTLNSSIIPNKNYYYITHGFGYSKFKNINDNFLQELEIFVPQEDKVKVLNFEVRNLINSERKLKLFAYIKAVLGEDEFLTNENLRVEKNGNILKIRNIFSDDIMKNKIMYISSSENIKSFSGDKRKFFGIDGPQNPICLYTGFDNSDGMKKDFGLGFEICLKFDKFEDKKFSIIIGEEKDDFEIVENICKKYNDLEVIESENFKIKNKWNDILSTIKVKTPVESLNLIMNGWLVYQTISSRILGRTGNYQSGGAFGFRDQLQDSLGIRYIDSKYLKEQILNCARHQFIEGDVLHWWHNETKKGIRTRISDDLLWLVYAVVEYIDFENNDSILEEVVEYLNGENLDKSEEEKYNIYYNGNHKESIFEHCVRAINYTISNWEDSFPKIGTGDWNDGFNKVGNKGKGQSVWLGFFLYDILNKFINICQNRNKDDLVKLYKDIKEKLKKNLNTTAWDGRWFKRAITDEGEEIGSINSDECRIDSISQSWAVISGCADNDKKFIAIEEAENYLVDKENKIIKLFDPPFEKGAINPGYIKKYPPGIRENGGQYTHAACWLVIAEAMLGFGDKAVELANMINPIEHSKTKEEAKKFKLEPYVMEADIYTNKDLLGRGGWNWYTGSSSWYYRAVLEYILGLKITNGYLKIEPCISKEWKNYEIQYKYKTTVYNIKVYNNNAKNTGIEKFIVNGNIIKENKILIYDDGKIYNIEAYM